MNKYEIDINYIKTIRRIQEEYFVFYAYTCLN